jgi:DNA-binding NtrC family response regulator
VTRSILLVDDDPEILSVLTRFFERKGWQVLRASDALTVSELYDRERPDIVLLDINLPGSIGGLKILEVLRARDPDAAVIMLTGQSDLPTAVAAMQLGAENFLPKPVELSHLDAAAERAYEKVELRRRNRYFTERQSEGTELSSLGRSPQMREIERQVKLLADSETTVLLLGETGTGKGWVANLLHTQSRRARGPFIEINCAGLSATFLDSELFGHEKGAYTDAKEQKRGLFEVAHTGSLFLDEIGDLAPELQPKLLKVLESRKFRRLGGTREIEVDVRVVAATNHDLEARVKAGRFREDLYYRLAVLPVRLPPLRERGRDDITELMLRILADLRRRLGRGPARVSAEALRLITGYRWPGNIRELRNVLERVMLLASGAEELLPSHLPAEFNQVEGPGSETAEAELTLEDVERRHIGRALAYHGGNRSKTAKALGISRATLYEKLHRYGLG